MSKIEWTNETWNPIFGCDKISPGCKNCYAEKMAYRLAHMEHAWYYANVLEETDEYKKGIIPLNGKSGVKSKWNGKTYFNEDILKNPFKWKKPRMIFVCSMGDLFHESLSFEDIRRVYDVIANTRHHTYQILTKRPKRMLEFFKWFGNEIREAGFDSIPSESDNSLDYYSPLKNLHLGVTAENQEEANKRIPYLLETPAAKRFVSIEPMLSRIELSETNKEFSYDWLTGRFCNIKQHNGQAVKNPSYKSKLDQIICGGETSAKARPMNPNWVKSLRDQCEVTKTPFFFKSWGEWVDEFHPEATMKHKQSDVFVKSDYDGFYMVRVGKKKAGCLIDGKEYKEFPI